MNDADAIDAATTMIDTRAWRSAALKLRLVQVVKLNTLRNPHAGDGVPLGARKIAAALGLGVSRVQVVMRELVDERVLTVRAAGAGSRGTVYELAEPRGWRVPWSIPAELVETRIAILTGRLVVTNPGVARAAWGRALPGLARAAWPRALDDASARSQAARATQTTARAAWGRALAVDAAAAAPISEFEDQSIDRTNALRTVRAVIAARLGAPVGGKYADRLATALDGADHEPIIARIHAAPHGLGLELLVQLVEQLADAQAHPAPASSAGAAIPGPRPAHPSDCRCGGEGGWWEEDAWRWCTGEDGKPADVVALREDTYAAMGG